MNVSLKALIRQASPHALQRVRAALEQDATDRAWASQVGPALTESDAAELLGRSVEDVATDDALVRVTNRDGSVVYPLVQFDGGQGLPGLAEVVRVLREGTDALGALAWLTGRLRDLDGRPVDLLRDGHALAVHAAAQRFVGAQR